MYTSNGVATIAPSPEFYRGNPQTPSGSEGSIEFTGDQRVEQFLAQNRIVISFNRPYPFRLRVFVVGGSTGTLRVNIGTTSKDFDVALLTPNVWDEVTLDFDENLWPRVWDEDLASAGIETIGFSGTLRVDDTILSSMFRADGSYIVAYGGDQPFLAGGQNQTGDSFSMSDLTNAPDHNTGKVQYAFWRGGYGSMPNSGAPTKPDPV